MGVFRLTNAVNNTFKISEVKNVPGAEKVSKELGVAFLKMLNTKLAQNETKLTEGQARAVIETIRAIRTECKGSHPLIYKLQSKLNPFSSAYKIKRLASRAVALTNIKELQRIEEKKELHVEKAKENDYEPCNYFVASTKLSDEIEKHRNLLRRDIAGYYYVCYLTSKGEISLKDEESIAKFAIEYQPDSKTARILSPFETSERRIYLPSNNQTEENVQLFFKEANASFSNR